MTSRIPPEKNVKSPKKALQTAQHYHPIFPHTFRSASQHLEDVTPRPARPCGPGLKVVEWRNIWFIWLRSYKLKQSSQNHFFSCLFIASHFCFAEKNDMALSFETKPRMKGAEDFSLTTMYFIHFASPPGSLWVFRAMVFQGGLQIESWSDHRLESRKKKTCLHSTIFFIEPLWTPCSSVGLHPLCITINQSCCWITAHNEHFLVGLRPFCFGGHKGMKSLEVVS